MSDVVPEERHDAVRCMALAYDSALVDDDHDCHDLFAKGLIRLARDFGDEYATILTDAGTALIRRALSTPAGPSDDLLERARDAYHDEYHRHYPPGGDAQDHHEAHLCGLEAVLVLAGRLAGVER